MKHTTEKTCTCCIRSDLLTGGLCHKCPWKELKGELFDIEDEVYTFKVRTVI